MKIINKGVKILTLILATVAITSVVAMEMPVSKPRTKTHDLHFIPHCLQQREITGQSSLFGAMSGHVDDIELRIDSYSFNDPAELDLVIGQLRDDPYIPTYLCLQSGYNQAAINTDRLNDLFKFSGHAIKQLSFRDQKNVDWASINLALLTNLDELCLANADIITRDLNSFLNQVKWTLEVLDVTQCHNINWDTVRLDMLADLKSLSLGFTDITAEQLNLLLSSDNLRHTLKALDLTHCKNINWDNVNLDDLSSLEFIGLPCTNITAEQLNLLLNRGNLRYTLKRLDLTCTSINWSDIDLHSLLCLVTLGLSRNDIYAEELNNILKQVRGTLERVVIMDCYNIELPKVDFAGFTNLEVDIRYSKVLVFIQEYLVKKWQDNVNFEF